MSLVLETDTGSSANITSELATGSYTASRDTWLRAFVEITGLNGAAATITVKLRKTDASDVNLGCIRFSESKDAAADTKFCAPIGPVFLASGEKAVVRLLSSNGSDTAVAWSVDWIDAQQVDVEKISGDSGAADNLEAILDGTGGQARFVATDTVPGIYATSTGTGTSAVQFSGGNSSGLLLQGDTNNGLTINSNSDNAIEILSGTSSGIDITAEFGSAIVLTGPLSAPSGIAGDLSGSVGGIDGVTFPANFDMLAISASGVADAQVKGIDAAVITTAAFAAGTTLPRVTLVETTETNSDMRGTDNALLASTFTTFRTAYSDARAGYMDKLNVTGILAHTDNADSFKADVSGLLTTAAFNAADPASKAELDQAQSAIESAVGGISGGMTGEQEAKLDKLIEQSQG